MLSGCRRIVLVIAVTITLHFGSWAIAGRDAPLRALPALFAAEMRHIEREIVKDGNGPLAIRGPWSFVLCDSTARAAGPDVLRRANETVKRFGDFRVITESDAPTEMLLDSMRCNRCARLCYEVETWTPLTSTVSETWAHAPRAAG